MIRAASARSALGALAGALAIACAASSARDVAAGPTGLRLVRLLPDAPRGWQRIEDPVTTPRDPELRASGLRASVAHHYTHSRGPVSEVCTVELWSFETGAQALAVGAALDEPDWWIRAAGPVLVLARGVRLERHVGSRAGLVPGCRELAEATHERATP